MGLVVEDASVLRDYHSSTTKPKDKVRRSPTADHDQCQRNSPQEGSLNRITM